MTKLTPGLNPAVRRVIVVVLDGAGVGALPDADLYGDQGSNTLKHVLEKHQGLDLKNLYSLGLASILGLEGGIRSQLLKGCSYGKMKPLSPGKDTTSGHWELAGLVLKKPFPVYPEGFPMSVIRAFEEAIDRSVLGNVAASGTEIIRELGLEHLKTGFPIVYTSADSVFQIAAHDRVAPLETLYRWCEAARNILVGEHAVGRVIARPFTGEPGAFVRTAKRRDFSLEPPGDTLLDLVKRAEKSVAVIGKVSDIFAHRGISEKRRGGDNDAIALDLMDLIEKREGDLVWATFGDFDTVYGHRNDSAGYAAALERFDLKLEGLLAALGAGDLLFITADHGCDPTFPTTDHTREYVPLLLYSPDFYFQAAEQHLGIRNSYADLAATAAKWLKVEAPRYGTLLPLSMGL
jgi:phosphopentomutase